MHRRLGPGPERQSIKHLPDCAEPSCRGTTYGRRAPPTPSLRKALQAIAWRGPGSADDKCALCRGAYAGSG